MRDERSSKSDKSQDSFLEKLNSSKEQNSLSDSRKDKSGKRYALHTCAQSVLNNANTHPNLGVGHFDSYKSKVIM